MFWGKFDFPFAIECHKHTRVLLESWNDECDWSDTFCRIQNMMKHDFWSIPVETNHIFGLSIIFSSKIQSWVCVKQKEPPRFFLSACIIQYLSSHSKICALNLNRAALFGLLAIILSLSSVSLFSIVHCLGLAVKVNKRYSQRVTKPFHVSQAVLDTTTIADEDSVVQVWVSIDEVDYLIANVSGRCCHVPMDITFSEGEAVAFYSKGTGTVHLSGCLLPEEDFTGMGSSDDELDR